MFVYEDEFYNSNLKLNVQTSLMNHYEQLQSWSTEDAISWIYLCTVLELQLLQIHFEYKNIYFFFYYLQNYNHKSDTKYATLQKIVKNLLKM